MDLVKKIHAIEIDRRGIRLRAERDRDENTSAESESGDLKKKYLRENPLA